MYFKTSPDVAGNCPYVTSPWQVFFDFNSVPTKERKMGLPWRDICSSLLLLKCCRHMTRAARVEYPGAFFLVITEEINGRRCSTMIKIAKSIYTEFVVLKESFAFRIVLLGFPMARPLRIQFSGRSITSSIGAPPGRRPFFRNEITKRFLRP